MIDILCTDRKSEGQSSSEKAAPLKNGTFPFLLLPSIEERYICNVFYWL